MHNIRRYPSQWAHYYRWIKKHKYRNKPAHQTSTNVAKITVVEIIVFKRVVGRPVVSYSEPHTHARTCVCGRTMAGTRLLTLFLKGPALFARIIELTRHCLQRKPNIPPAGTLIKQPAGRKKTIGRRCGIVHAHRNYWDGYLFGEKNRPRSNP